MQAYPHVQALTLGRGWTRPDALLGNWRGWLKWIERELVTMHRNQALWDELRDEIVAKRPNADGTWLLHYSTIYAKAQMLAIRKLSSDRRGASLGELVRG